MYLRLSPYREVLQGVLTNLRVSEGIVKITGKSGAGKTALCSQLFHELESEGQPALFFLKPPASATDLQNNILDNLHLDPTGNFTRTLTAHLLAKTADLKPLVLIFDDAHQLDQLTFSAIRMLCNIQNESHSLVRVILCGMEELDEKLATPALRAVTQFLSQSVVLPYLTQDQVHDFCQGYWALMGEDMKPLSERVLQRLTQETQGHPGILQARLNQGTTGAEKSERHKDGDAPPPRVRPRRYAGKRAGWVPALLVIAGLLLVGGVGAYLYLIPVPSTEVAASASTPATTPLEPVANEPAAPAEATQEIAVVAPAIESTTQEVAAAEVATEEVATNATPVEVVAETPAVAENTVAPAATEPPPVAPETATMPAVDAFITEWAQSWQNRDVDAYLAHYHADFTPAQGVTQDAWREQRRRVIGNAGEITLGVAPLEYTVEAADGTRVVRFWLDYSTATYADRTLKELQLAPVDGSWRILAETNLQTERK